MDFNFSTDYSESVLKVDVDGSLTAANAPSLMDALSKYVDRGVSKIVFDFTDLEFVASAGLRVILMAKQKIGKDVTVQIKNPNESIAAVLKMTGFESFLEIISDK